MKNKIITLLILLILIMMIFAFNSVEASSASLKASNKNPTVGESVTVTATVTTGASQLELSGAGKTEPLVIGDASKAGNETSSVSITFTPTEAKEYTSTLTGNMTDFDTEEKENVNKSITITAKEKQKEEQKKQETQNETKVVEPNFTSASKTMYTSCNVNLRSSWSTSSSAIEVPKGTELTVTATSTNTVNGYVWYRVSYNGQTKYIASKYLTSEKPEEPEEPTKSDNANLKTLVVEGQTLSPEFSKTTTSYTIQIANEITNLEVKAEAEDEKATVSVKGNENLQQGENTITVSVSSEDGTVKIYEIKVERAASVLGLQSLRIEGTKINTTFKPDKYDYKINVKDVDKLVIEAIANKEDATVEILGNEDLKEGDNTITIIVSSKDGEEKVTYQITASKVLTKSEEVKENKGISPKIYLFIGLGVVVLIALILVIVYTIKHRKQDDEFEYTDKFEENKEITNDYINKEEQYEVEEKERDRTEETEIDEENVEDKKPKISFDDYDDDPPRSRRGKHF